jgi:YggT family protein
MMLLKHIIDAYSLVVFAAVIVSWVRLPDQHPIARFLRSVTEPLLRPIRAILPRTGGLDFSPMVLLIGLQLVGRMLL